MLVQLALSVSMSTREGQYLLIFSTFVHAYQNVSIAKRWKFHTFFYICVLFTWCSQHITRVIYDDDDDESDEHDEKEKKFKTARKILKTILSSYTETTLEVLVGYLESRTASCPNILMTLQTGKKFSLIIMWIIMCIMKSVAKS